MTARRFRGLLTLALLAMPLGSACSEEEQPVTTAQRPTPSQPALRPPARAAAAPTASSALEQPVDAQGEDSDNSGPNEGNAWNVPPRPARYSRGDRVYVLTRGEDRSYTDADAAYQMYAHDVAAAHGHTVTLQQPGGGRFEVPAVFTIAAGSQPGSLKKGQMVLAEWASSLKHAVVRDFVGDKVKIRYTDLPESWSDAKITALKSYRELTAQTDGFEAGNFAVAEHPTGSLLVMFVSSVEESWLVRDFAGRVSKLHRSKLTALPIKPRLRRRQKVLVPWIGLMYSGTVVKLAGTRVLVQVAGIGQKLPISVPLGQVRVETN